MFGCETEHTHVVLSIYVTQASWYIWKGKHRSHIGQQCNTNISGRVKEIAEFFMNFFGCFIAVK